MSINAIPILQPLVNDINSQHIGYFLKTNYFKKLMIKHGFHESWNNMYEHAKKERNYFADFIDHEVFDSLDAFVLMLNSTYNPHRALFYDFVFLVVYEFHHWEEKDINLPFDDLIEDFNMLDFPVLYVNQLIELQQKTITIGPSSIAPVEIWNSEKLNQMLAKMDNSISNGDYNLTLTYSYSSLEGLFKAFILAKIQSSIESDKLQQMAALVKNHLIAHYKQESKEYPEAIFNLISTITNAISATRNSHSDSHFDKPSEKWLAQFSRDCVNTIGNLIISFLVRS
ncbi:hypothetical protein [Pedobacter helvus]|uniref:Abortive infection protein-like C-terminal domain-containing protein n=1 Tax=Pedobacter helvus TaxID=2563444 RepID=A0ABW9JDV7_9SPHI|nr:hypothetical protein [Pedobacter ureilyticus]